ncbi:type IV secretion system DNA-binding domain-containing protein [Candidatus Dojkabacteria bacterium]|nr:type IV secretion system DNA-binding domain-containing protein [Candidatus Dojkabacteria bacterium]
MNLPVEDATIFAETDFRERRQQFGIKKGDRRLHFYLLGKTGSGKSTVFKNMITSDILAGEGVAVIDPHGELVEDLLNFIPSNRINDVVYFDPADVDNPIGFNLLELDDQDQRDMVADGVVEVFKKHFEYSWGPRLQYVLTNAILTILEAQGQTLLAVQRMLIDKNFRKFVLKQVKDPLLLKFWNDEYAKMETNSRLITEAVAPIQNKVGRFLASATIRNIVGQVKSTINLREIMDEGKIFLVNLSQGRLGEESSALLGGMIVTRLQTTAMERVDTAMEKRRDFFMFVDEFQNYATDSFAKILSEARKYRLCLHLTHQYIDQLPENVRTAIFGNVGTLASFVVGPTDAMVLAKEFAPVFDEEDMVSLERYAMYLKLSIDGMVSIPFSARSLDVRYEPGSNRETVLQVSRERYGRPRDVVEDKINRWSGQTYSEKGNRSVMSDGEDREKGRDSERKGTQGDNRSKSGGSNKRSNNNRSSSGGKTRSKDPNS